jgi:ATP-dependent DNA ligase
MGVSRRATTTPAGMESDGLAGLLVPPGTLPMEARSVEALPDGPGWQYEPKWDGFRCLAFRAGGEVELQAKSGKILTRYFPEVAALLGSLPADRFVADGELAVPAGDSLSFDALQLRLHPAESRIRRLAAESPAIFILFDLLTTPLGESLLEAPLTERRAALEGFHAKAGETGTLRLSPYTRDREEAQAWLDRAGGMLDGIVAKRLDGRYKAGERAMLKVKRLRTADCVVGGFRYGTKSREVGSLLLGLYGDDGMLHHVGFTSTIGAAQRAALTGRLEALIEPPGFTGNAPGGPSRWATERSAEWQPLRPELVVEVRYDHVTGDRFRHGTALMRWRPDKAPRQCTFDQLEREARPARLIAEVLEG